MNLAVVHEFAAARQQLWDLLMDPARLANCIPGCEDLREVEPDKYSATLKIGVAAIKGVYTGKVEIGDKREPEHYKLSVEGSATPGFVRGTATMDLAENGERSTRLSMNADAQVGGLIASVGQRFLSGIARQMTQQFFRNVEKELQAS